MKFNDKIAARNFMINKRKNSEEYTDLEKIALLEYFSEEEIKDGIFITWEFNNCLRQGIDAPTCQPHLDVKAE